MATQPLTCMLLLQPVLNLPAHHSPAGRAWLGCQGRRARCRAVPGTWSWQGAGPSPLSACIFHPAGLHRTVKQAWLVSGTVKTRPARVLQGYAWEMTTAEGGWGLHSVLQTRTPTLDGIVNGIDLDEWNPASDRHTPAKYSAADLAGRRPGSSLSLPGCRRPRNTESCAHGLCSCLAPSCAAQLAGQGRVRCACGCMRHAQLLGLQQGAAAPHRTVNPIFVGAGKAECKAALQKELGLPQEPGTMLVGWIGRLDHQKGPDVVLDAVPGLMQRGCQAGPAHQHTAALDAAQGPMQRSCLLHVHCLVHTSRLACFTAWS